MKMPRRPPVAQPDTVVALVAHTLTHGPQSPTVSGRYLHWDELRHRPPPEDLTVEAWWHAVRVARRAGSRTLDGLRDVKGRAFTYLTTDRMQRQLHELTLQAGGTVRMPEQLTPATRDQYVARSLVEEAITSSQLEGAVTTRRVAREMLRTGRSPRDKAERMVFNNFITMQRIRELVDERLTLHMLFELHRLVTEETLERPDGSGRFRRSDEEITVADMENNVFHRPPEAAELPARFQRMATFANEEPEPFVDPVLRAIILHFWLAYDHPFVDGNGRTARALFYWSMLRHGYWLAEFISISEIILRAPAQYYRAFLFTETDDNDLTYFLVHQLDVIEKAVRKLHEYIAQRSLELGETERLLHGSSGLNHRQKELVRHALRHPHATYTIEGHRRSHGVAYATARGDLMNLAESRLFERRQEGKRYIFLPMPDLRARLTDGDGSA